MKKRGFTLIELLAVIVIIGIVLLITVPLVLNVIRDVRGGAFGISKRGVERAAEIYYTLGNEEINWENDIAYIEIGTLKQEGLLKGKLINSLNNLEIKDTDKVLLYKENNQIKFSLQLYDQEFLKWYQNKMINAVKSNNYQLPTEVDETTIIPLNTLMDDDKIDELRLSIDLTNRCEGYVEVEKLTNKYDYTAYVDCLEGASTFASHYVSYGGKYLDEFNDVIETNDGGYLAVGGSNSEKITNYNVGNNGGFDAIIVKFKSNGEVEWAKNFGGSNDDEFNSVVEGPNGYIAVGKTSSDDGDIEDYKGGVQDALIVSYDFDGNILYKKSYGCSGAEKEQFNAIIHSDNEYILVGTIGATKDGDLADAETLVRQNEGIIIKFNRNFEEVWRTFFVGSHVDTLHNIIQTQNNNYILSGVSFSNNKHLKNFNKGHSDAILVSYDQSLNLKKTFQEPVVLIEKLKSLIPNYGQTIQSKYENIYTTNNPTTDIKNWRTAIIGIDNSSNYINGYSLYPFNEDDVKKLVQTEVTTGLKVLENEHEYKLTINPDNFKSWHYLRGSFSSSSGIIEISNLKLKFSDGFIGSINNSFQNDYIEPLLIISNSIIDIRETGFFPTIMDIINDNGTTGEANYPSLNIHLKPKKAKLSSVIFTSNKDSVGNDGFSVFELRNFDMSITPTN